MSYTATQIEGQSGLYQIQTINNGEEINFNVGVASEDQLDEVVAFHLGQLNGENTIPEKTYKANRMEKYPTIEEQLDDIFHNGIDGWKATIQAVKDEYPKPE